MKKQLRVNVMTVLAIILLNSSFLYSSSCNGIRRIIVPSGGGKYINGSSFTYNPGDTLVLKTLYNPWTYFTVENIHGTAACPVVIINEGGQVKMTAGMAFTNCSYLHVTGTGTSTVQYGFKVQDPAGSGTALDINHRSKFIEVDHFDVHKKTYGAWIKQEADCDPQYQYPNWHIDNISLHDCKFFNIGQDCIYAGSTSPTGQRTITCTISTGTISISPIPLRLSNINIYNNYIDSVNRTGIQLSGADSGSNNIYNNIVRRCGYELNQSQGSGIIIGGMSHVNVHNNTIRQTFQYGINAIGSGFSQIENNNIDSTCYLQTTTGTVYNPGYFSIGGDTRNTVPQEFTQLWIKNNIIGINGGAGTDIAIGSSVNTWTTGNVFCGNTRQLGGNASLGIASSIQWSSNCSLTVPAANFSVTPNPVCAGKTVTITDMSTGSPTAWSYTIAGGTPSISTAANPTVSFTSIGIHTISLVVSNTSGTSTPITHTITINANPTVAAISNPTSICSGKTTTITASGANTYTWSNAAISSTISVNPTITTTYYVTGTNTLGCANTKTISITVLANPTVTAVSSPTLLCVGQAATITCSGAVTYTWTNGPISPSISVTPTITSTYTVNGTASNGCKDKLVFTQNVSQCTGVEQAVINKFNYGVYPNPTSGIINIKGLDDNKNVEIKIYNLLGQMVKSFEYNGNENVSIKELPSGMYWLLFDKQAIKVIKE